MTVETKWLDNIARRLYLCATRDENLILLVHVNVVKLIKTEKVVIYKKFDPI